MTKNMLTVAAIQTSYGEDMAANIARTGDFIREAASRGAQVILPSELFQGLYFCTQQDPKWFETAYPAREHPCVLALSKLAKELSVVIPISFFEKDGPRYFNSVAVADADGEILGVYRKSHIPDGPGYQEKYYFRPGDTGFKTWKTKHGVIGVGICWDQWFPECRARHGARRGAGSRFTPRPSARSRMTPRSTRTGDGGAPCRATRSQTPCRSSPRTGSAWRRTARRRNSFTVIPL